MKMYTILQSLFLFCMLLAGFTSCSEAVEKNKTEAPGNNSTKAVASYKLAVPDGWTTEPLNHGRHHRVVSRPPRH
ncbi:MAG: hypothetical protein ABI921_14955, partial [Panacibacter sp.]